MMYQHHQLEFEIDDMWLAEAKVLDFKPSQDSYLVNYAAVAKEDVFTISIDSVEPSLDRAKARGIFCDDINTGESAKQRVMRILIWLQSNHEIEPVKVVPSKSHVHKYKLVAGCHRFHCALALGFKSVPATKGFDMSDPNA
jgi:hypothetical protein